MNIKMAMNSQLSTIESIKQTKHTSRTGTEYHRYGDHSEVGCPTFWPLWATLEEELSWAIY